MDAGQPADKACRSGRSTSFTYDPNRNLLTKGVHVISNHPLAYAFSLMRQAKRPTSRPTLGPTKNNSFS
jgi:hypothetical protein